VKLLVTNADDFGLDPAINAAVAQAHTHGILTSASLMIRAPHAAEAVALARAYPGLGVGLHLCLPVRSWRGQLEAFLQTGLRPTHLDTHQHVHLLPGLLEKVARLAAENGIGYVRAPVEPLTMLPGDMARTLARGAVFGTLGRWCRWRLRRRGLRTADRTVGVLNAGRLTEEYLLAYTPRLPVGVTEVVFHPATATLAAGQRGYRNAEELAALCGTRWRAALAAHGVRLTNFRELVTDCGR
jgi:predicted glycoside hydrolase/deacetylase ChbG (UPF0249 family)